VRGYVQRDALQLLCCPHAAGTHMRAPGKHAPATCWARTNSATCFRETYKVCGLTAEGKEPVFDSRDNTKKQEQCSERLKEISFATQELEMCTDIIKQSPSKGSLREANAKLFR